MHLFLSSSSAFPIQALGGPKGRGGGRVIKRIPKTGQGGSDQGSSREKSLAASRKHHTGPRLGVFPPPFFFFLYQRDGTNGSLPAAGFKSKPNPQISWIFFFFFWSILVKSLPIPCQLPATVSRAPWGCPRGCSQQGHVSAGSKTGINPGV